VSEEVVVIVIWRILPPQTRAFALPATTTTHRQGALLRLRALGGPRLTHFSSFFVSYKFCFLIFLRTHQIVTLEIHAKRFARIANVCGIELFQQCNSKSPLSPTMDPPPLSGV